MKIYLYALLFLGAIVVTYLMWESDADKCMRLVESGRISESVGACESAANHGVAESQYILGVMYAKGEGVKTDAGLAADWYGKAAQQGHAAAQYNLGYAYANGIGVPKDDKKAFDLYLQSAEAGYPDAQHNLGYAYLSGHGVAQDYAAAYAWFSIASSNGQKLAAKARELISENLTDDQRRRAETIINSYKGR